MSNQLMTGKRGLIMGLANDKSIAWGIARALADAGFETVRLDRIFLRKDGAANIEGFLVVARKAGSVTVLPEAIAAEVEETAGTKPGEGATRH